jgi:hypothetical protein
LDAGLTCGRDEECTIAASPPKGRDEKCTIIAASCGKRWNIIAASPGRDVKITSLQHLLLREEM